MDADRFDDLSRRLATDASRRRALQAITAAGAAGLLTRLGRGEAAAQDVDTEACKDRRTKCGKDRQCCGHKNRIACDPVANKCRNGSQRTRCCGRRKASCKGDCDCCKGLKCKDKGKQKNTCR